MSRTATNQFFVQILVAAEERFVFESFSDALALDVGHGVRALLKCRSQFVRALCPAFLSQGDDQSTRLDHVVLPRAAREVVQIDVKNGIRLQMWLMRTWANILRPRGMTSTWPQTITTELRTWH